MSALRTTDALYNQPVGTMVEDASGHLWAKFARDVWICEHAEKWSAAAVLFDADGNEVVALNQGLAPTLRSPSGWDLLDQIEKRTTDAP